MTLGVIISFFAVALLGMPLAFALGVSALVGLHMAGVDANMLPTRMMNAVNAFPLMSIPFFILAGELMMKGGIMERLIDLANAVVGRVRGGLAHVTMLAGLGLSTVSGAAVADALLGEVGDAAASTDRIVEVERVSHDAHAGQCVEDLRVEVDLEALKRPIHLSSEFCEGILAAEADKMNSFAQVSGEREVIAPCAVDAPDRDVGLRAAYRVLASSFMSFNSRRTPSRACRSASRSCSRSSTRRCLWASRSVPSATATFAAATAASRRLTSASSVFLTIQLRCQPSSQAGAPSRCTSSRRCAAPTAESCAARNRTSALLARCCAFTSASVASSSRRRRNSRALAALK